ncbi:MAG: hypothetical protein AAFY71_13325 [Bacteroidota bacterium]
MIPDLNILEQYLAGELGESEREKIEQMLKDDPMLSDALEGLKEVDDMSVAKSSIASLHLSNKERIEARLHKREQLSRRKSRVGIQDQMPLFMGIAAGLAILLVGAWLLRRIDKDKVPPQSPAVVEENQAQEEKAIVPGGENKTDDSTDYEEMNLESSPLPTDGYNESLVVDMIESEEVLADNDGIVQEIEIMDTIDQSLAFQAVDPPANLKPAISKPSQQVKGEEPDPAEVTSARTPATTNTMMPQESIPLDYDKIPLEDEIIVIGENENKLEDQSKGDYPPKVSNRDSSWVDFYEKSYRLNQKDNVRAKLFKSRAIRDILYEGINAYRNQAWQEAGEKFEEILRTSPDHVLAHHYLGLTRLEEDNLKKAMFHFEHNINFPGTDIYQESMWNLAQVYLDLNKKGKARKQLEKIINEGETYSAQAKELLQQIK